VYHDVVKTWKPLVRNSKFFAVNNYTPQEAAEAISSNQVDGVFFGRPWIANPDFPQRVRFGLPMNAIDIGKLYGPKDGRVLEAEELAKGYTDYPLASVPN